MPQEERDRRLKETLSADKINFLDKYELKSSPDLRWYSEKNNSPARVYFKHQFLLDNEILEIVFRKYQLCFAKIKYFRGNLEKYDAYKYDTLAGFIPVALWDAEFFRHKRSNKFIDFRQLQQITDIQFFQDLTQQLDGIASDSEA